MTTSILSRSDATGGYLSQLRITERVLVAGLDADQRAASSEAARARLSFLLGASKRLGASLESATVMQSLLDIVVPTLADAAVVRVVDPARRQPRVAVAACEPLGARSSEWWSWLDRVTRSAVRRALQAGASEVGSSFRKRGARHADGRRRVSFLVVPLHALGRTLGSLSLVALSDEQRYEPADQQLGEALGAQVGLALHNARLYEEQQSVIARLDGAHAARGPDADRLLVDERRRIARELHDGAEQTFFAIALTTNAAVIAAGAEAAQPELVQALGHATDLARSGAEQLRDAIFALNANTPERGLIPALMTYVKHFRERTHIDGDLTVTGETTRTPRPIAAALRAVVRESLANVERHSRASTVIVAVNFADDGIMLSVHDDGVGPRQLLLDGIEHSTTHFGLRGIRERVERLNGTFAAAPGDEGGFVVRAHIPLPRARG